MKIEIAASKYNLIESKIKQLDGPAGSAIRSRSEEKERDVYDPFTGSTEVQRYYEVEIREDLSPMQYMMIGKIIM